MATISALAVSSPIAAVAAYTQVQRNSATKTRVSVPALSNFSGLKASSSAVVSEKKSVEQSFSQIVADLRQNGKGGALTTRCDVGAEIAPIIPIISGLTLLGVAIGFVLLRVEAAVEEQE
eukprot:jgi/Mesen1/3221/ME001865S02418